MKLNNIVCRGAAVALVAVTGLTATAQNLTTGYFDDNYSYRFQLNPAFAGSGSHGFVAMPGLGNLNAGLSGNTGLDQFLYNIDGKTTTFLNPGVDAGSFIDGLKDRTRLGVDLRETILAGGFKGFGGYNTIAISARANVGMYLPKDIFRLAKEGATNSSYNIGDLGAQGTAWAEISFGHSRDINSQWRVGGSMKILVGAGNIDARFHNANLTLGEDTWTATVDAELSNSVKHLDYKMKYNDRTGREYVSGFDYGNFAMNGMGIAFDLGGVFTLNSDWQFSASVLDLGFITWDTNNLATTHGAQTVVTDRYSFDVDDFDHTFDKFKDDLTMLYQLDDAGDQGSRTTMLGTTLNFGAEYTLPVYRKLTFGLLNTTRIQGKYSWTDFRLSANVRPVKCFSAAASFGMGTFGASFGWMLNFSTTGFNLFLASDVTPFKLAKQGVPLNSNANVNLGINFPF